LKLKKKAYFEAGYAKESFAAILLYIYFNAKLTDGIFRNEWLV